MLSSAPARDGESRPLLAQLGDVADLVPDGVAAGFATQPPRSAAGLRAFVEEFQSRALAAVDLPAILRAHRHSDRNELRELLSFDRELSAAPLPAPFKAASQAVGRRQLHKLRPLRDRRLVQRYIAAVDAGQAHAWHTLVFGLALSVFSLPLRQGMLHYAQATTRRFVVAAAPAAGLVNGDVMQCVDESCRALPQLVEAALARHGYQPAG